MLVVALLPACGELELPPPPDMSKLVEAYENPTGELTTDTALAVGEEVVKTYQSTRDRAPSDVMRELIERLQDLGGGEADDGDEGDGAGTQRVNGSIIDVAAVARLHRICAGWEGEIDEGTNGFVDMVATLDNGGLIPIVWGQFQKCRYLRGDFRVELDGDVRIRFGTTEPRVGLRYLTRVSYLVHYIGDVVVEKDDERAELTLDSHFQVSPEGVVRMLITVPDAGTFVTQVDVSTLDPKYGELVLNVGLFAADSFWQCSISLQGAGGSCTDASDPEKVVSW